MILPLGRAPDGDYWTMIRARMLRETEAFLEDGLRRPEQYRRIPAVPVGSARFPHGFADAFWAQLLATS